MTFDTSPIKKLKANYMHILINIKIFYYLEIIILAQKTYQILSNLIHIFVQNLIPKNFQANANLNCRIFIRMIHTLVSDVQIKTKT